MKMKKIFIKTLGCKVNQCESEMIENALVASDGRISPCKEGQADIVVVNTCTVTGKAAMQSRQAIRKAIRNHPNARIVVTGCHAQTSPEELAAIEGVHWVVGNQEKPQIPSLILAEMNADGTGNVSPCGTVGVLHLKDEVNPPFFSSSGNCRAIRFAALPGLASGGRTRPLIKIQDGCNAFCTYCIVPHARGRSRSLPVGQVLDQVKQLGQLGYREVVLTGIHIGCYGHDLFPSTGLYDLLCRISQAGDIDRVRISSIEPVELSNEIIDLASAKEESPGRLCPHFHIPLQSGDNTILKRMHRPYSKDCFKDLVANIADRLPHAAIGVDTLIGFPGESADAFENTFELIRSLPVAYLHVFPFSARKGTPAFSFKDPVHSTVIKKRCKVMRRLGEEKRRVFYERGMHRPVIVLVEETRDRKSGRLRGITDNYVPILFDGPDAFLNTFQQVQILRIASDGVEGKWMEPGE